MAVAGACVSACGPGPVDNSTWTLRLPPEAVVHRHPFVAPDDPRRQASQVELVREWTAGDSAANAASPEAEDQEGVIYRARRATVDRLGHTWVMDSGDASLKVFDDTGRFLRSVGGEGQGPAELGRFAAIVTSAGDQVVVSDDSSGRLSFWGLDGQHVGNAPIQVGDGPIRGYAELYGFDDGTFAGAFTEHRSSAAGGAQHADLFWIFERLRSDGDALGRYAEAPTFPAHGSVGGRPRTVPAVSAVPRMAATRDGDVYVTAADKYQVLAFTREGALRWALRVDWPNAPYPASEADRAVEAIEAMGRALGDDLSVDRSSIVLPDHAPAISQLRVDAAGRLYLFPWVQRWSGPNDDLDAPRPVDVYSRDGELLFNGQIEARFAIHDDQSPAWMGTHENSVRGLETNPDTQELRLVSYRLSLPVWQE